MCLGIANDQAMLHSSPWNQVEAAVSGSFLSPGQQMAGDGGYWPTAHITMMKPATVHEISLNPDLRLFNHEFNGQRGKIECGFGALKKGISRFAGEWNREFDVFPLALESGLKMLNHYWIKK